MNLGTAEVLRADSRHLPLADNSVDLVVTSPPYFALRSYQDGGEHYDGQIGAEPTPDEFVTSLLEVTAECVRVLKPSGSLWVNLGDKYAGSGMGGNTSLANSADYIDSRAATYEPGRKKDVGVRNKSLMGLPWRYALRCIDELGLILRAEVIWSKPNGLPESVTDRVRRSHEQWFHFTLQPRYFSAVDEIREAHSPATLDRNRYDRADKYTTPAAGPGMRTVNHAGEANPLGKLPGSVWTVPTEPLRVPDHLGVDHFAAFPTEWPKRIIQGWSPAGVCVACGEGRRPVVRQSNEDYAALRRLVSEERKRTEREAHLGRNQSNSGGAGAAIGNQTQRPEYAITGYTCACMEWRCEHITRCADAACSHNPAMQAQAKGQEWPPPTTPAVVLDPFGGTGTTAMVAKALGRHGISVDMSADYCRLAEWRTNDRDQLAKVLGVAKAEKPHPDETPLFDLDGGAA